MFRRDLDLVGGKRRVGRRSPQNDFWVKHISGHFFLKKNGLWESIEKNMHMLKLSIELRCCTKVTAFALALHSLIINFIVFAQNQLIILSLLLSWHDPSNIDLILRVCFWLHSNICMLNLFILHSSHFLILDICRFPCKESPPPPHPLSYPSQKKQGHPKQVTISTQRFKSKIK